MGIRPIGIEGDGPLACRDGFLILPTMKVDLAQQGVCEIHGVIQGKGFFCQTNGQLHRF